GLIRRAVPSANPGATRRHVDVIGALLCVLGLGGTVFALIEQPRLGWSNPAVTGSLIGGLALFAAFLLYESRARDPMLRPDLFKSRNFAMGNIETLALYGGLSALFFFPRAPRRTSLPPRRRAKRTSRLRSSRPARPPR